MFCGNCRALNRAVVCRTPHLQEQLKDSPAAALCRQTLLPATLSWTPVDVQDGPSDELKGDVAHLVEMTVTLLGEASIRHLFR